MRSTNSGTPSTEDDTAFAASDAPSSAVDRRSAIRSSSSWATSSSIRTSVPFKATGTFLTSSEETSPVSSPKRVRTSCGVSRRSSSETKASAELRKVIALFSNSSIGRLLMRVKTPSTVAAASETSLSVVGISARPLSAASNDASGTSSTVTNSTFKPPVSRLAEASRARRPFSTRSCKKASAASAVTSSCNPRWAGWIDKIALSRTRLSPKRSKSTRPERVSTSPISSPLISTGAPTISPEILSSNTTLNLSGSTSEALKTEFRAVSLSG